MRLRHSLGTNRRIMVASPHVARPDLRTSRRRAQSGAVDRRRARDRRSAWARAAARGRGRRVGQDGDACASGRGAHPRRRRSEAHHARDLLAPRGGRAWPARRAAARPASCARGGRRGGAGLRGDVPRHRRKAPARICDAARPRSAVHHPRPRGFGGPDELGAARSGPRRNEGALPDQGDVPRDLLAGRQRPRRAQGHARQMVSLGRGARGRSSRAVRSLRRDEAAPERARLRRPPALFRANADGACDRGRDRRPLRSPARRRIPGHQRSAGRNRAGA